MANQWPELWLGDGPNEESSSAGDIVDDWSDIYLRLFTHIMANPTTNVPPRYFMNLMIKINEFINQLASMETKEDPTKWGPEKSQQTGGVMGTDMTGPKASSSTSPKPDLEKPKTWQEFVPTHQSLWDEMAEAYPDQLKVWKECVNVWNNEDTLWETKSECEEACVLGLADHLTYENDSTMDYESDSESLLNNAHIAESFDGGSDDEIEETEMNDIRKESLDIFNSETAIQRYEAEENVVFDTLLNNSPIAQDETTERPVWDVDRGEYVVVSPPHQSFESYPPSDASEDSSSIETSIPGEFLGYMETVME